jgi:hypothetical protein
LQPNFSHPKHPQTGSSRHLSVWQVSGNKSRGFRAILIPKTGTGTVTLSQRRRLNNSLQELVGRNNPAPQKCHESAPSANRVPQLQNLARIAN